MKITIKNGVVAFIFVVGFASLVYSVSSFFDADRLSFQNGSGWFVNDSNTEVIGDALLRMQGEFKLGTVVAPGDVDLVGDIRVTGSVSTLGNIVVSGNIKELVGKPLVKWEAGVQDDVASLTKEFDGVDVVPKGLICLWSSTTTNIPVGWVICDGTNNTPDLRDRFVRGSVGDPPSGGNIGGIPTHNHTYDRPFVQPNATLIFRAVGFDPPNTAAGNTNLQRGSKGWVGGSESSTYTQEHLHAVFQDAEVFAFSLPARVQQIATGIDFDPNSTTFSPGTITLDHFSVIYIMKI